MKQVRVIAAVSIAVLSLVAFGQLAWAGEWGPANGYNGADDVGQSDCVFNGRDDPDPEDDALWQSTPAGGRVQSGGQLIARGYVPPGIQGEACNAHLNPLNP